MPEKKAKSENIRVFLLCMLLIYVCRLFIYNQSKNAIQNKHKMWKE